MADGTNQNQSSLLQNPRCETIWRCLVEWESLLGIYFHGGLAVSHEKRN